MPRINEYKLPAKFTSAYLRRLSYGWWEKMEDAEDAKNYNKWNAYSFAEYLISATAKYLNTSHDSWSQKKENRLQIFEWFEDAKTLFNYSDDDDVENTPEVKEAIDNNQLLDFCRKYIPEEKEALEALDHICAEVYPAIANDASEREKYTKYRAKQDADRAEREKVWAEQSAKRAKESQFLKDAAEKAGVEFFEPDSFGFEFTAKDDWFVILDTEDEDEAEKFRFAVGDLLEGTENAYGASYDDIPGMGDIHLGCVPYYEFSEMTGGDVYDDLDEDVRDKYTVFACSRKNWIEYRRQNDW